MVSLKIKPSKKKRKAMEKLTLEGNDAALIQRAIREGHITGVPVGNGMVELVPSEGFRAFMKAHGVEY